MDDLSHNNQGQDAHMMDGMAQPPLPPRMPPPPPPIPPQRAAEPMATSIKNSHDGPTGEQEQKVATPPSPPIQVRSLESDMKSLESSGGVSMQPEIIKIDELNAKESHVQAEGVHDEELIEGEGGDSWGIVNIIGVIVLAAVLGLLGYYVVYPLFFDNTTGLPPEEKLGIVVPTKAPVKPIERLRHQSLFTKLPTLQGTAQLSSLDGTTIVAVLQNEAVTSNAPIGAMKELALQFADSAVSFSDIFSALVPGVQKNIFDAVIEPDVTAFLYFNNKGIWPGYVVRLKQTAVVADAQATLAAIEQYSLKGLYLSDPGVAQPFQTGPYKGSPIRFSTFAKNGASFNYGVLGSYAVFSTSFDGFKAALDLLGL